MADTVSETITNQRGKWTEIKLTPAEAFADVDMFFQQVRPRLQQLLEEQFQAKGSLKIVSEVNINMQRPNDEEPRYLTRTIFDVFNCTPTMPPDGFTYLQVVFERCGVEGGTQLTLLPYAVAGLIVYTAGYPAFIGYTLWKNREIVMEDQLLRAKGVGTDLLSGPRTYNFRLTYGRSYFQFKPDLCLWILAIVIRKFFIALTAVVFNKNASFQMAACYS